MGWTCSTNKNTFHHKPNLKVKTPREIVEGWHNGYELTDDSWIEMKATAMIEAVAAIQQEAFESGRVESQKDLEEAKEMLWVAANMLAQSNDTSSWCIVRDDQVPEIRHWVLKRATTDSETDKWIRGETPPTSTEK